jgi:hydroxymethylbilane synthase
MGRSIRIGTRGSDLALVQARLVAALLRERCGIECALEVVATAGDRDRTTALHELAGTGFFTKELQSALGAGSVDLVVHSLKDLPTLEPEGLTVAAVLARDDPADVLLVRPGSAGEGALGLRAGATVGTSSLRRAGQALALQPGLAIAPLRGNVPTRLRRLREGACDAIVLAAAGLARLRCDLSGLHVRRLDPDAFVPAPGQAALAIEARSEDRAVLELAETLDDPPTAAATACERSLLRALEGGCSLPLGALARCTAGGIELRAALATLDAGMTAASVRGCLVQGEGPADTAARALAELNRGDA